MAGQQSMYRPLLKNFWFGSGRTRVWQAADHLLFVEKRFFSEHYTRFYLMDIQAIVLYQLRTSGAVLLAIEGLCVAVLLGSLLSWRIPWVFVVALLFVLFYVVWRWSRPSWACEIATRTNRKQFALPGSLVACREVVNQVKQRAILAQGPLPETTTTEQMTPAAPIPPPAGRNRQPNPKQPVLAVHVIAFVLGVLSAWSAVVFAIYCGMLLVAYLLQRDFRFPFAVRSAAVMSQILAVLQIAFWGFAIARPVALAPFTPAYTSEHWQFALPRIIFSIYGIAAVYWGSLQQGKPQQKTSSVLGLSQ